MEIREQLTADVKSAMLAKDSLKLNTLRFLQAAIKNREIEIRQHALRHDRAMNCSRMCSPDAAQHPGERENSRRGRVAVVQRCQ